MRPLISRLPTTVISVGMTLIMSQAIMWSRLFQYAFKEITIRGNPLRGVKRLSAPRPNYGNVFFGMEIASSLRSSQ